MSLTWAERWREAHMPTQGFLTPCHNQVHVVLNGGLSGRSYDWLGTSRVLNQLSNLGAVNR